MHAAINDVEVARNPTHITLNWQSAYIRTEIGNDTYDTGSNCGDYSFHGAIDHVAITSLAAPVRASFTWTPSAPTARQQVRFTDTSTGSPATWSWHFGDGFTSSAQNPTHAYVSAGTYTVTQTVTANGVNNTTSHVVNVSLPVGCVTPIQQLLIMQSAPFSSSCISQDLRGHLAKFFTFQVQTPTLFAARLSIPSIDAHISLLAGNNEFGRVLATDERSGGGKPAAGKPYAARLSRTLAPGTYTLEVTTAALVPTTATYSVQAYVATPFIELFVDPTKFSQSWTKTPPCTVPPCDGEGGTIFLPANVVPASGVVALTLSGHNGAEIVSVHDDFHYGRYLFLATIPDTHNLESPQGSVIGLFTYQKDKNFAPSEIDIEFLTRMGSESEAGKAFFTVHSIYGSSPTNASIPSLSLLSRPLWYEFDWSPSDVAFHIFTTTNTTSVELAHGHLADAPSDEATIHVNIWAGVANFGGLFPQQPIVTKIYQVEYHPAFFPAVSATP